MIFKELSLPGLFLIENFIARDNRGVFVKTFHHDNFKKIGLNESFLESYYSTSAKNVVRGMHFQIPPFDHHKLVHVTSGKILDVVLDLRRSSPTYGKSISIAIDEFSTSVFIPKGCAHGFLALSETATVVYNVSTLYNNEADKGVLWNSFGFEWPVAQPVMSARDKSFPPFNQIAPYFLE